MTCDGHVSKGRTMLNCLFQWPQNDSVHCRTEFQMAQGAASLIELSPRGKAARAGN